MTRTAPTIDRVLLPEGGLFLFGAQTTKDVEAYAAEVIDLYHSWHGCSRPAHLRHDEVARGLPAIGFTQVCAGGDVEASRVVMVNEGFGLVAFITANSAHKATALDRLFEILGGLEWTSAGQ